MSPFEIGDGAPNPQRGDAHGVGLETEDTMRPIERAWAQYDASERALEAARGLLVIPGD